MTTEKCDIIFPEWKYVSIDKPRESCVIDGKLCIHLNMTKEKDIYGKTYRKWECTCEDDLCASCIPETEEYGPINTDNLFGLSEKEKKE